MLEVDKRTERMIDQRALDAERWPTSSAIAQISA